MSAPRRAQCQSPSAQEAQSLVLRAPDGPAVAHLVVTIPECSGRDVAKCLLDSVRPSFGPQAEKAFFCSIGFSFAGLKAMKLPTAYLRLFQRLAPAFAQGAVQRSAHVGDSGASAAQRWQCQFGQDRAHLLLSWHGSDAAVKLQVDEFTARWRRIFDDKTRIAPVEALLEKPLTGARLGAPPGEEGEWVHFGFRDGISEVCIDDEYPSPLALDCRQHTPGTLLLGHVNDAGFNSFALSRAPDKVRAFFRNSSFGILRPMAQKVADFEDQVDRWADQISRVMEINRPRDFVKAKLCGRWPNGRLVRPGDLEPLGPMKLNLGEDGQGEGCPFGSHVRRMRTVPDGHGNVFERPLQRRSFPFGSATFSSRPAKGASHGQLGHFFCASIEDQFEHLLGQWAARPPLGFPPEDSALDPFSGPHEDSDAALLVPLQGRPARSLQGFRAWTTTMGMMYAWHPGKTGLKALLEDDFVPDDDEGPWL